MKKKKKNKLKIDRPTFINLAPLSASIKLEITAVEDDGSVYIKMSGFNKFEDVVGYAEYLAEYFPLLLYQTEVVH